LNPLAPQQAAFQQASQAIDLHDRVCVADGSVGTVIGFYGRAERTVLVRLDSGESREFEPADLRRIS
jgi:hypothetical protein